MQSPAAGNRWQGGSPYQEGYDVNSLRAERCARGCPLCLPVYEGKRASLVCFGVENVDLLRE